jgi:predicted nucleotidyltransferase
MTSIQIEQRHFEIIQKILNQFAITAFVFGSRAKNTAKPLSDLDLCLKQTYDKTTLRKLHDAFEESDLPFKVDVVIWTELSEGFKKHIENDLVKFE